MSSVLVFVVGSALVYGLAVLVAAVVLVFRTGSMHGLSELADVVRATRGGRRPPRVPPILG